MVRIAETKTALALIALTMFAAGAARAEPGFKWSCSDTGKNSMQCQVRNTGSVATDICMDVVKVCKDGDHIATLCSGIMQPGETESKVIPRFDPKIRFFEKCMGTEYRNKIISQQP